MINPQQKQHILYGKYAVFSALKNVNRKKIELLYTDSKLLPKDIYNCNIKQVTKAELDKRFPANTPHGGIALICENLIPISIEEFLQNNKHKKSITIVGLDQITDPQNVGAILRSALAFNIDAILTTENNSFAITSALAKAACGALDIIPIIKEVNLAKTINILKNNEFWVIGMDGKSHITLKNIPSYDRKLLILGSEGEGMRRITKENCDIIAKIEISSEMESLNVSNAAAIVFYELYNK